MPRLFINLFFLCLIASLVAEEEGLPEDPFASSLVNTQTLLPTTVHAVSVLSGEWLYSVPDLAIQGPEPLVLNRSLSSDGSYSKKLAFHWDFNLPPSLIVEKEPDRVRARYRQACGITTIHESTQSEKSESSHSLLLSRTKGLTNCYAAEISARTNLHNTVLNLDDKGEQCAAASGYGHVTYFKRVHETLPLGKFGGDKQEDTVYMRYKSDFERKANGNLLLFRKEGLYAFNPAQSVCYSWIKWNPIKEDTLEVTASDGKKATYLFSCYESGKEVMTQQDTNHRPKKEKFTTEKRYALKEVNYSHRPSEKYDYHCSPPHAPTVHPKKPLLSRIERGEGRFQAVTYYKRGQNPVEGRGTISILKEGDERIDRVKEILAPVGPDATPIVTHRFLYHLTPAGGQTEVIDAYGQKTLYTYCDHQRLNQVERFDQEGRFISKSCMLFDDHSTLFQEEEPLFEKIQEVKSCFITRSLLDNQMSTHRRPHCHPNLARSIPRLVRSVPTLPGHRLHPEKKKKKKKKKKHRKKSEEPPAPALPLEEKQDKQTAESASNEASHPKRNHFLFDHATVKLPVWMLKALRPLSRERILHAQQALLNFVVEAMQKKLAHAEEKKEKEREQFKKIVEHQKQEDKKERRLDAQKIYQRLIMPLIEKLEAFFGKEVEHLFPILSLPPEELIQKMFLPLAPAPRSHKKGKGNLLCRYQEDAEGRVLSADLFDYDQKGNIIAQRLYGNLTGQTHSLPHKSRPEVECYQRFFNYSNDCFNLLLGEQDEKGRGLLYLYEPDSNRLAAKFITYQGQIYFREFYTYDENTTRIRTIKDDGTSNDPNDLSGCHERHITDICPRREAPFGLPEKITESYQDLVSGEQRLLKKMICHYDAQGHLIQKEHFDAGDHLCYSLYWTYDSHGNCLSETNPMGQTITRHYDANDHLIEECTPTATQLYTYDFANRLIAKETHLKQGESFREAYTYDLLGNRQTARDRFGQERRYAYDSFSRLIKTDYPQVVYKEGIATPTTQTLYDSFDRPICQIDSEGRKTETLYNSRNQPIYRLHPDDREETWEYTIQGSCCKWKAPNGTQTHTERDFLGRPLQEKIISSQGELFSTQSWVYEGSKLKSTIDPEGVQTIYTYDAAGRLASERKGKAYKGYHYDSLNRLHQVETFFGEMDSEKQIHTYHYDLLDRLTSEHIEDSSHQKTNQISYQYDEAGNLCCTQEDRQDGPALTSIESNSQGDPLKITQPSGETTHFVYDYSYRNALGQMVLRQTKTDALGRNEHQTFDALGRLVERSVQDPFGMPLIYEKIFYDLLGRQVRTEETRLLDGEPQDVIINQWCYHLNGKEQAIIESAGTPEQKITSFYYNALAQKVKTLKPDGRALFYTYDPMERMQTLTSSDESLSYRYTYNPSHQPTQVEDLKTQTLQTCHYDENGQLIEETFNHGLAIHYCYDRMGRVTALHLPGQSSVEYKYDAFHLRQVERSLKGTLLYTHAYTAYDPGSLPLQERLIGLSGDIHYAYDPANRPKEIRHDSFIQTIPPHGFDKGGRLREVHTKDSFGSRLASFNYDPLDHLQEEKGRWNHHYQTDSLHNRCQKDTLAYQTNARHQLLCQGSTHYLYDPNGNLIEKQEKEEKTSYTYDALDRLTAVRKGDETTTYTYDAFHRRLSKKTKDKEELYLYVGTHEIGSLCQGEMQELRILGHLSQGERGAIAIELRGKTYAPLYDCQGDLVALINSSTGETQESYSYCAFGEEKIYNQEGQEISHSLNPWRFACKRKDAETGWVYFGRRFYDPETGRWTTPDPLLFADGSNPYAYLHHSPLMAYDPNGLLGEAYNKAFHMDCSLGSTNAFVAWPDFSHNDSTWEADSNTWEMLSDCYQGFGGALHGALDFASRTMNDLSAIACMIGSEDLGESLQERLAIQGSFFDWQDVQKQNLDHWVTGTLHLDPNHAAYQSTRYYTEMGLEVGTVVVAGVQVARGALSGIRTLAGAAGTATRNAGKVIGKEIGCGIRGGIPLSRGAESVNAAVNLGKKLSQLEGAQQSSVNIKTLLDGRIRYYDIERTASTSGPTRGRSYVTEINPTNGHVRTWMECYDHAGKVNRVHPKQINGQEFISPHYPPTARELGL